MARIRGDHPEPEITPADPADVLGTEPTPGSDVTATDTTGEPVELDEDAARERAQRELDGEPVDDAKSDDDDGEPFMSEGVRQDLVTFGRAVDPMTGGEFVREKDSDSVTFTPKARLRRPEPVEQPDSRPVSVKLD